MRRFRAPAVAPADRLPLERMAEAPDALAGIHGEARLMDGLGSRQAFIDFSHEAAGAAHPCSLRQSVQEPTAGAGFER